MKVLLSCFAVFLMTLSGSFLQAQEPLVLYDDFNEEFIDVRKWSGGERTSLNVILLENIRQIHGGRLQMLNRVYGGVASTGVSQADNNLSRIFAPGEVLKATKASVKVNDVEATGCPGNPTRARARIFGAFFNSSYLPTPPSPPGRFNDLIVQVTIHRASDSINKPQILDVLGEVINCFNADCTVAFPYQSQKLGNVLLGQWANISVEWDQNNKQFIFMLDREPPVAIPYPNTFTDNKAPSSSLMGLGASQRIANCGGERKMAYIDAEFENIFVNE